MAELGRDVFVLEPRRDRPQGRFNLVAGLAVAVVASLAYVLALTVRSLPSPSVAAALFTAGPVLCLVALIIYWSVTSDLTEPAARWAAAGIAVSFVALTLQYISFPIVAADGGVFGTGVQSSAALYLLFHFALYAGAAVGAAGLSPRWVGPFVLGGAATALAIALDLVPLPVLIDAQVVFTPLVRGLDGVLLVMGAVATLGWVRRAGRTTTPLAGWFGVGLALSLAELGLNAAAAQRYDAVWWSSLSLRVATFGVLAFGAVGFLLRDRRRFSGYTESELHRRESQLTATGRVTDALMANAVLLSRATTPRDVADTLAESVCALTACQRVLVLEARTPLGMTVLASRGYDPASLAVLEELLADPATRAERLVGRNHPFYEVGREPILARYPLLDRIPAEAGVRRMAVVPMEAAGVVRGTVSVSSDEHREWNATDRAVLAALAAQGGPALARASLHAQEHHNAEVLQRSLLPPTVPTAPGLEISCRYLPGDSAATVGGDWYDVEVLPDRRVLLTVGDVVGKGIRAAAMMGMLRQSARALARVDPGPGQVLDRLDEVGVELGDQAFATVLGILWDPTTSCIRTSRAGHPPAVLVRGNGHAVRLDAGLSPPIGSPVGSRSEHTVPVQAGDHLVLYTDGLVESRDVSIDEGIDDLIREAERGVAAGMSTDELADHLLALRRHEDDVALLVARVREVGEVCPATFLTPAAPAGLP
jgi:serine phosphatase RsbU (regulator of sigma subunit)